MSNEKFTDLPSAVSANLTDIICAVQGGPSGTSVQQTLQQVSNLLISNTILNYPGNPNGNVAGTTYQLLWDTTDKILYVCTTTGNAASAVWTVAGSLSIPVPVTQGGTGLTATTINQILYSSANNVIAGLATANSGVLITSAGGIPSISSTLPTAVQGNITQLGAQSQALNMNTHLINNVVDPVSAQDAMTLHYGTATYLPLAGGTMTGQINFGGLEALNAADPIMSSSLATKNYVDQNSKTSTQVYAVSAGSLGSVTQSGAGVGATLTNNGSQAVFSLDSVNPPLNSFVLIKNIATGMTSANEGIYQVTNAGSIATNWVLTRSTSYDTPTQINDTGLIIVQNGATLAGSAWYNSTTMVTVDITAFSYMQFGAGSFPVTLADGGTSAALTASAGGIFYSTSSTGAILSGTATANQILLSGSSSAPAWSTATYPATTTINQLLYSSANNTIAGLATATTAVLTTSSGVPTWASELSLALGGTNAALTASNGGIFYSTASAGAILAGTATAGQIIRSGASSAPSWSTATYPATAGTQYNALASDGTNFTSQTLTALLDGAIGGTQGNILYRSATVWTVLAPGTSGNFLQTQGAGANPQWAAGGGAGVVLQVITSAITATSNTTTVASVNTAMTTSDGSQIKTLTFTPVSSSSKLDIRVSANGTANSSGNNFIVLGLFIGASSNCSASSINYQLSANVNLASQDIIYSYAPGSTSTITFAVRAGLVLAGTWYYGGISTETGGGTVLNYITITEHT